MGDFKLVKTWEQDRLELFDLSRDLSEANDLYDQMPEKATELHNLLATYLKETGADTGPRRSKNDPAK